ncbi:hypothetical protein [Anabaena sp. CCY 9910]|uniref:hypothetical protein n=1 Tax=Anabaena sp. CCY 9910 TaxID=3103870 RepID=UPI0039E0FE06
MFSMVKVGIEPTRNLSQLHVPAVASYRSTGTASTSATLPNAASAYRPLTSSATQSREPRS